MNRIHAAIAAVAVSAPLVACNVTTTGEEGLVRFTYDDPVATFGANLDHAIAAGTRATIEVQSLDATAGIRVRAATFETAGVADVVGNEINELQIEGLVPGETRLIIETDRGRDATMVRVAEATSLGVHAEVSHEKVLIGGIETLTVERRDSVGELLVGVAPAEMDIVPTTVAERVAGADHQFRLRYLEAGGQSFSVGDSTLVREVVTADAVAGFDFASAIDGATLPTGGEQLGVVMLSDANGDTIAGAEGVLQITSLTPEVCSARFETVVWTPGLRIEGLSAGACIVEGTLGGHTAQITLTVD